MMYHSAEELEQKIRGMLFLSLRLADMEKKEYNVGDYNHVVDNIRALAGDIYNEGRNIK
tara:strand:+ start:4744 stop:4920 length:177 start_codon:yes stop_codon:yes gene_type:complete